MSQTEPSFLIASATIECDEEYNGNIQFWSGHGHAFASESLAACMVLSVPINYRETVGEMKDRLKEEARANMWDVLKPELQDVLEDLEDERITAAIDRLFEDKEDLARLFDQSLETDEDVTDAASDEDEANMYDDNRYIAILHVYIEDAAKRDTARKNGRRAPNQDARRTQRSIPAR